MVPRTRPGASYVRQFPGVKRVKVMMVYLRSSRVVADVDAVVRRTGGRRRTSRPARPPPYGRRARASFFAWVPQRITTVVADDRFAGKQGPCAPTMPSSRSVAETLSGRTVVMLCSPGHLLTDGYLLDAPAVATTSWVRGNYQPGIGVQWQPGIGVQWHCRRHPVPRAPPGARYVSFQDETGVKVGICAECGL